MIVAPASLLALIKQKYSLFSQISIKLGMPIPTSTNKKSTQAFFDALKCKKPAYIFKRVCPEWHVIHRVKVPYVQELCPEAK